MTKKLGRGLSALISTGPAVPVFAHHREPFTTEEDTQQKGPPAMHVIPGALEATSRESQKPAAGEGVRYVEIDKVRHNPNQPRKDFKEAELNELAQSIKELGVLQPVLARVTPDGAYEIVAGERRWRAAQMAGLSSIPAIVRDLTDRDALEISIVENVQRENLNPIEEARAYERLAGEFHLTHGEIAERVAKDRSSIANMLRLLKLPQELLDYISEGKISIGHAKAILGVKEPAAQVSLAKKVIGENLSVRDLETIVARVVVLDTGRSSGQAGIDKKTRKKILPGHFGEVEDELRRVLGTRVAIRHKSSGRGRIEIEYFSEEELSRVVDLLLKRG